MATPFETFVNGELPKRISIAVPASGNLDPDKYVVSTGVGLGVKLVDAPGGSATPTSTAVDQFLVPVTPSHDFTLSHAPLANSETVMINGLVLVNYNSGDYSITGSTLTLSPEHVIEAGDVVTVRFTY